MSHLRPSLLINDVYGSAGEVTAYHKGGKCFLRKRVGPKASTAGVAATCSAVHLRALEAWRALPHDVQRIWNDFARDAEPHRPPFDHSAHISGNNLFVSAYHGFATLGAEHVPGPRPFESFPPFAVTIAGAELVGSELQLRFKLTVEAPSGRYRLLAKLQFVAPGMGRNPGLMKNYLTERTREQEGVVIARVPMAVAIGNAISSRLQVYGRCILLDTKNGYRSQFVAISEIVSL